MPADTIPSRPRIYPIVKITKITDPSKFYAFPLIGIFVKIIMLIPVYIFLFVCTIANLFLLFINSFVVLFTGKYMRVAYDFNLGLLRLNAKIDFFYSGLTNKYPGFSFNIDDTFTVDIPYPENPNRWFAIPLLGGLIRILLLIPYYIYTSIVKNAVSVALFVSWIPVLFQKYYPDTTFELDRDSVRLNLSPWTYFSGLSDTYPSFWISMNHKQKKILLLIAGILLFIINSGRNTQNSNYKNQQKNMYPNSTTPKTQQVPYVPQG